MNRHVGIATFQSCLYSVDREDVEMEMEQWAEQAAQTSAAQCGPFSLFLFLV